MCLAIAGIISEINGDTAKINYGGITKEANLRLFPDLQVGDYVLVHAGFVIQQVSADEGEEIMKLDKELGL